MGRLRAMALAALGVAAFGSVAMAGKTGGTRSVASVKDGMAVSSQAAAAVSADGTGNLSKLRRDELVKKIAEIRRFLARSSDTNAVRLVAFADELAKEVKTKKYGLVFEEHKEKIDVQLERSLPMLAEDRNRFIDNGGELNFLIEGDNLAALKLLEKTHRGKIDLIYIDPPYNTGNKDFVYNDQYVDANDTFRHSKWLSFMQKRLEIARRLLTDKGVVFISIDDNEVASLKILCEGIFGDENFVASLPTIMNLKGNQDEFAFAGTHEYTLVFVRNKTTALFNQFVIEEEDGDDWMVDEIGCYKKGANLKSTGVNAPREKRPNLYFPIYVTEDNRCLLERTSKSDVEVLPITDGAEMSWRWSKRKFKNEPHNLIVVRSNGNVSIYKKQRPSVGDLPTKKPKTLFYKPEYSSGNGTSQLKKIFGSKVFSNPKPVELISDFIEIGSSTNAIVLDFFAGSGTAGHAVMNLNAKDGGKRKFILVTNNENGICEKVTYERLKRVIEKEKYAARLKYMKIDYLPIEERMYDRYAEDLLKHVRELVELENGLDFERETGVAIVLTDAEAETLAKDKQRLATCRVLYKGHNVLLDAKTATAFAKSGVTIRPVPKYYYPELEY